jgi:hypothetical protein
MARQHSASQGGPGGGLRADLAQVDPFAEEPPLAPDGLPAFQAHCLAGVVQGPGQVGGRAVELAGGAFRGRYVVVAAQAGQVLVHGPYASPITLVWLVHLVHLGIPARRRVPLR